jgi:hypothetical protein
MSDTYVRKAEQRDIPLLAHWMSNNAEKNLVDPAVFGYPNTQVYVAHKDWPIAFMPVQLTMTLESLGFKPDASVTQRAEALAQLFKTAVFVAREKQIAEIYFVTGDDSTAEFAKNHGFKELSSLRTLRLRIADLECTPESIARGKECGERQHQPLEHNHRTDEPDVRQLPTDPGIAEHPAPERN